MLKASVFIATSVDGFIARSNRDINWLPAVSSPPPGAVLEFMAGSPAQITATLSTRGFRHVYVDGGITIQRFLEAGLIQRLTITRVPCLIGSAIPLLGARSRDRPLRHITTSHYPSGLVTSVYAVGD